MTYFVEDTLINAFAIRYNPAPDGVRAAVFNKLKEALANIARQGQLDNQLGQDEDVLTDYEGFKGFLNAYD